MGINCMKIIPTILTNDTSEAEKMLGKIVKTGKYQRVQFDFLDGEFAKNTTLRPEQLRLTGYEQLGLDAHLMVKGGRIKAYTDALRLLNFDRIIPHFEQITESVNKYNNLAVDLSTSLEMLEEEMCEGKDLILLLGVPAGWGGQKMDEAIWDRIAWFDKVRRKNNWHFKIGVDGGVQKETLERLEKWRVDEVCVGSERLLGW